MLPNSFSIGPLTIHIYGIIIATAILIGWFITKKRARLFKISPNLFDDPILLLPFIFGIAGGRLYHVIDKWTLYASDPIKIFKVWEGGLGIFGALTGIFVGLWIIAKAKKIDYLRLLDLIAPSLILGQAIGRVGNFINQEGYAPSSAWPVYFYEAGLEVTAFIILIYLTKSVKFKTFFVILSDRRESKDLHPGQVFGLYLILYSLARSFAEIWRTDTAQIGGIHIAYLVAVLASIIGIYLIIKPGKTGVDST